MQHCQLGLFQGASFAGELQNSSSASGGMSCIFGSHTFVLPFWMCDKQAAVRHRSPLFEIIALDAGL